MHDLVLILIDPYGFDDQDVRCEMCMTIKTYKETNLCVCFQSMSFCRGAGIKV